MEVDMLAAAVSALEIILQPERLLFVSFGVFLGLMLGVIPGIGGLVGLALLLPFTFDMDPFTALAFMVGLISVTVTSDTIPAVLFGVPGTVGSAATILDGHPMARQGQAGRAFGAAFSASILGGLFGALLLGLSIPVLRPIMLNIGTPELLAICVFGLSLVAVLTGGSPLKGLVVAAIGLLISTTGDDQQTGTLRWTFDTLYLWDGVPIVPVALGLFALPEICDLVILRTPIAGDSSGGLRWQQLDGVKDTFRNLFLVARCAFIGSGLGAVPGLGASVIDWIAYGHALRTEKNTERFGQGDVRGVIASESSNNAKEGGSLIPTIAFGVPGSASMALLLGAFLIHGIIPGPDMLTTRLDVTYTLVWSVAIANILGAGVCFLFANQFAKLALIRIGILAPVVLAITYVGAFQGSRHWADFYLLLGFGFLGWIMKRLRWPRPPLILGFVLGGLVERYMFISIERYGADWLLHPIVLAIFGMTILGLFNTIRRERRRRAETGGGARRVFAPNMQGVNMDLLFTVAVIAVFASELWVSSRWELGAKLVPQVVGWLGLVLSGCIVALAVLFRTLPVDPDARIGEGQQPMHMDVTSDLSHLSTGEVLKRAGAYFGWSLFFLGAAALVGILPAMLLFMIGFMRFEGRESWRTTLSVSICTWVCAYALFHFVLAIPWPRSVVGDYISWIRDIPALNIL